MRRKLLWALASLALLLVLVQLIPVAHENPPVTADLAAPAEVRAVVRTSCYGCHSNETVWPWYSRVAPASWLVAYDVREGRAELNFSEWESQPSPRRQRKLEEMREEVGEGAMPPWIYLLAHPEARLAPEGRAALFGWIDASLAAPSR